MQALLRNPLAEPYVLGLSSGAAAGVMGQALLARWWGLAAVSPGFGAVVGAGLAMGVVYMAGRRRGLIDPVGLLLVGVVLAAVFGAVIMAMNVLARESLRSDLLSWMMGYLDEGSSGWRLGVVAAVTGLGLGWLAWRGPAMDAATLSPSEAESVGVDLKRLRLGLFVWASVLAAGAVVLSGPIAFVGLIAPHLGRLALGPGHRGLVWASAMIGAGLVVMADTSAAGLDWAVSGLGLMPVGVFTALIGGPVFVAMLRPHLGRGEV